MLTVIYRNSYLDTLNKTRCCSNIQHSLHNISPSLNVVVSVRSDETEKP